MIIEHNIAMEPKEEYEPLYTKRARYKDLWGGRGRGGSHEATLYALMRLTSKSYARIAFVRKVFRDVKRSLWQDFKDRIDETGTTGFHLNDQDCSGKCLITGNTVTSFGVKAEKGRTAKLKSLAGFNVIIIEEADELTEEEFNTIDDSLRTIKGDEPVIIRIFNPPGRLHWLWKSYNLNEADIYDEQGNKVEGYWKATPKSTVDLLSIFGTYQDNYQNLAKTTLEKWLKYKLTSPEYYWTMIMGLISEGQRGRVYKGWRPITDQEFQDLDIPSIFALDFGWGEAPMALAEVKMSKGRVYGRELMYKPMTLKELAIELCKLGFDKSQKIVADSADPVSINRLRTGWKRGSEGITDQELEKYPQLGKGFNVVGAIKGPGSVNAGIMEVQSREVFITEDSLNWWAEYQNYRWALDVNKNPTNVPEDDNNHLMDDLRYIVTGKGRVF